MLCMKGGWNRIKYNQHMDASRMKHLRLNIKRKNNNSPRRAGASLDAREPDWEERRRQKTSTVQICVICVVRLEDTTPPVHEAIDGGLTDIRTDKM
jgi:hypothetical protein